MVKSCMTLCCVISNLFVNAVNNWFVSAVWDKLSQETHLESLYTLPKPRFGVTYSCLYEVSWQQLIHYANVLNIAHCQMQASLLQTMFPELVTRLSCGDCYCTVHFHYLMMLSQQNLQIFTCDFRHVCLPFSVR